MRFLLTWNDMDHGTEKRKNQFVLKLYQESVLGKKSREIVLFDEMVSVSTKINFFCFFQILFLASKLDLTIKTR